MILRRNANVSTHRYINNILSSIVAFYSLYILALPLIPHVSLWWSKWRDDTGGYVYVTRLQPDPKASTKEPDQPSVERKPIPQDNRLVLPTIELNEKLVEGTAAQTVHLGAWRKPNSSTPNKGGNTVIVGHRFTYSDPAVFFHLDKIKKGDLFPLYWEGEEYDYIVSEVKVVNPDQVSIEDQTNKPIVTIYTCTPIWTSKQRLVIVADLIDTSNNELLKKTSTL